MIKFDVKVTTDRAKFLKRVETNQARILARTGRYYQRVVKSLLRRKKPRKAPAPPSHGKGLLRDHVFFNVDLHDESVVIGPEKLRYAGDRYLRGNVQSVPELLEKGGSAEVIDFRTRSKVVKKYDPRPYVSKKEDKLQQKLAENIKQIGLV